MVFAFEDSDQVSKKDGFYHFFIPTDKGNVGIGTENRQRDGFLEA
jgi:hypothetical protein